MPCWKAAIVGDDFTPLDITSISDFKGTTSLYLREEDKLVEIVGNIDFEPTSLDKGKYPMIEFILSSSDGYYQSLKLTGEDLSNFMNTEENNKLGCLMINNNDTKIKHTQEYNLSMKKTTKGSSKLAIYNLGSFKFSKRPSEPDISVTPTSQTTTSVYLKESSTGGSVTSAVFDILDPVSGLLHTLQANLETKEITNSNDCDIQISEIIKIGRENWQINFVGLTNGVKYGVMAAVRGMGGSSSVKKITLIATETPAALQYLNGYSTASNYEMSVGLDETTWYMGKEAYGIAMTIAADEVDAEEQNFYSQYNSVDDKFDEFSDKVLMSGGIPGKHSNIHYDPEYTLKMPKINLNDNVVYNVSLFVVNENGISPVTTEDVDGNQIKMFKLAAPTQAGKGKLSASANSTYKGVTAVETYTRADEIEAARDGAEAAVKLTSAYLALTTSDARDTMIAQARADAEAAALTFLDNLTSREYSLGNDELVTAPLIGSPTLSVNHNFIQFPSGLTMEAVEASFVPEISSFWKAASDYVYLDYMEWVSEYSEVEPLSRTDLWKQIRANLNNYITPGGKWDGLDVSNKTMNKIAEGNLEPSDKRSLLHILELFRSYKQMIEQEQNGISRKTAQLGKTVDFVLYPQILGTTANFIVNKSVTSIAKDQYALSEPVEYAVQYWSQEVLPSFASDNLNIEQLNSGLTVDASIENPAIGLTNGWLFVRGGLYVTKTVGSKTTSKMPFAIAPGRFTYDSFGNLDRKKFPSLAGLMDIDSLQPSAVHNVEFYVDFKSPIDPTITTTITASSSFTPISNPNPLVYFMQSHQQKLQAVNDTKVTLQVNLITPTLKDIGNNLGNISIESVFLDNTYQNVTDSEINNLLVQKSLARATYGPDVKKWPDQLRKLGNILIGTANETIAKLFTQDAVKSGMVFSTGSQTRTINGSSYSFKTLDLQVNPGTSGTLYLRLSNSSSSRGPFAALKLNGFGLTPILSGSILTNQPGKGLLKFNLPSALMLDGGSLPSYGVSISDAVGSVVRTWTNLSSDTLAYDGEGLSYGSTYTVSVEATNSFGLKSNIISNTFMYQKKSKIVDRGISPNNEIFLSVKQFGMTTGNAMAFIDFSEGDSEFVDITDLFTAGELNSNQQFTLVVPSDRLTNSSSILAFIVVSSDSSDGSFQVISYPKKNADSEE